MDIGNDGSAFVELFVSRSSSSKADDWTVLLPATLLMTPSESRSNTNRNHVKLLKSSDLNKTCLGEKWDRLKIVCEQKFNRLSPYGLCFIKLYSPSTLSDETNQSESLNKSSLALEKAEGDDDDETRKEQSKIGSFFAKKQAEKKVTPSEPSPSNQIRALSNVAEELLSKKPMNDNEIQTLLKKDVTVKRTHRRSSSQRFKFFFRAHQLVYQNDPYRPMMCNPQRPQTKPNGAKVKRTLIIHMLEESSSLSSRS